MDIKRVGSRGVLFTFYDLGIPTNVYVILGNKYIYVIDTYLGPDSMTNVMKYIDGFNVDLPKVVINTHSHWDHVWGNCFFLPDNIYSHVNCKKHMLEHGKEELDTYSEYKQGDVQLVYPVRFIDTNLMFEEDNVLVYYTPGHSDDCVSIYDMEDKVFFAGDNIERPIPYFSSKDLNQYVKTLEEYLTIDANFVIGGHTGIEDRSIIFDNLNYVKKVLLNEEIEIKSEEFRSIHSANLDFLQLLDN